jgi:ATP-dependent Clp protease adaptor protein ClpS
VGIGLEIPFSHVVERGSGFSAYWSLPETPARMANPSFSPEAETVEREQLVPLYHVVLLDDNDHTYDYVIEMLQKIFIFTMEQAYRHAEEVDRSGRTILITCELAQAEFARDQIQAYGPDWRLPRSKGSMSAIVEPATS